MTATPVGQDPLKKPQPVPGQPSIPGQGTIGATGGIYQSLGSPGTPPPMPPPQTGQIPTGNKGGLTPPVQSSQAPPQTSPQTQTTPPPMAGDQAGTDPNAALGQIQGAFQQKFGRAMSPEEQQALIQYVGYTGGQVTPDMLQKALAAVGQYSGNLQNPGLGAPGTPPVTPQTLEAQQRESLMALLQGKTPVTLDPNDPAIRAQRSAFDRVNTRATGRQRLAAAERAAASDGLGSGGYNADLAGAEQGGADRSAAFEGDLLTRERQGQIDRLMQSLGLTQQYGATQLQGQLGRGQLSLGLLQALMNDKQAGNALGFNYASLQNLMNNQALMALLNGL